MKLFSCRQALDVPSLTFSREEGFLRLEASAEPGTLVMLFVGALLVSGTVWWLHRGPRIRLRRQAETLYKSKNARVEEVLDDLSLLEDRASIIKGMSAFYSGRTRTMSGDAIKAVDELSLLSSACASLMRQVHSLIFPDTGKGRIINHLTSSNYREALHLLQARSVAFDPNRDFHPNHDRDPIGDEASREAFDLSISEALEDYADKKNSALSLLSQLENVIRGLPDFMDRACDDLLEINNRLRRLDIAAKKDGFFRVENVRKRLIPSSENLLEVCARKGIRDPISALESPGRLARRQIDDARKIIGEVERIRSQFSPRIDAAVRLFNTEGIYPKWIEDEFEAHSEILNQISSHAVLWPIDEFLETFSSHLSSSMGSLGEMTSLYKRLKDETAAEIKTVESEISQSRIHLGHALGVEPEMILREGALDPSQRITSSAHALEFAKRLLSGGHLTGASESVSEIESILGEAKSLLKIGKTVAEHGDSAFEAIADRLLDVQDGLSEVSSILADIDQNYSGQVYQRFGLEKPEDEFFERKLAAAHALLEKAPESYQRGHLLAAGRYMEGAADIVRDLEIRKYHLNFLADLLDQLDGQIGNDLGDLRWRLRTVQPKADDRRTRWRSRSVYQRIKGHASKIELELSSRNRNPFELSDNLESLRGQLKELEDGITADWDLHSLATNAIKSAGRSVRKYIAVLKENKEKEVINPKKYTRASESLRELRGQLTIWQTFLEEDHLDWQEAFQAGVKIETESVVVVASVNEERKDAQMAADQLRKTAGKLSNLYNLKNRYQKPIERGVGLDLFNKALNHLRDANYIEAIQDGEGAFLRSEATLNQAKASEKVSSMRSSPDTYKSVAFESPELPTILNHQFASPITRAANIEECEAARNVRSPKPSSNGSKMRKGSERLRTLNTTSPELSN